MGKQKNYRNDTQEKSSDGFCSKFRLKYILLTTVLVFVALGAGFGIGYVFKKDKITSISNEPTEEGQFTHRTSSRLPTTTTTTTLPIRPCPPTLLEPTTSKILLSLNETINLTAFRRYSLEYVSPVNAATAMLMFEFNTVWGSWYLDDVSVKESNSNQEIIDNGGFETGNLGSKWSYCDPRYSWIIDGSIVSHTAHSGQYSYESKDPGVGSQEYLTQIFNIKSNTKYTIEFYLLYMGEPSLTKVTVMSR